MKNRSTVSGILLLFLATSLTAFAQEQAQTPQYQSGESWQFKVTESFFGVSSSDALDGVYEVRISGKKVSVLRLAGGQREVVKARSAILRQLLHVSEDNQDLRFPLSAGQKWSYDYESRSIGARRTDPRNVEVTVSEPEQVTTPAGTFKAFKLKKEDSGPGQQVWVTTYYYSPDTRSIIKSSFDSTGGSAQGVKREIELIKSAPR